ncbi:MAG: hypothetical protein GY814_01660 [Gammaproteobacteria bacterium]|nr:hypothetical protein [Gammaproteobacteria bacterium]
MSLIISQLPGRHERHLLRKRDNPLFPETERSISPKALLKVQRLDHEELVEFITGFHTLVQKTVNLKPNEESEVILGIKEQLDMAYEQASVLADDQTETKQAISKLTHIIMNTIRTNATGDALAMNELEQEDAARSAHYALLQFPIVADLLHPESLILEQDLAPTLLSEDTQGLQAAMQLFDPSQLQIICEDASELLRRLEVEGGVTDQAKKRLTEIGTRLTEGASGTIN